MLRKLKKYSKPQLNVFSAWGPNSIRLADDNNVTSIFQSSHLTCTIVNHAKYIKKANSRTFLKRFFSPQRIKYKFIGKAYRLKFKDGVVFMRFHRSHKTHFYYRGIDLQAIRNKGFNMTLYKTHKEFLEIKKALGSVRRRNLFTSRGLWATKTLFYKKKGKISGYR